jgi:hypothetical protein
MTTTNGQLTHAESADSAEAASLDAKSEKVLREALTARAAVPMATEESIRAGKAAMKLGRKNAARTLLERIARYELITEEKFTKRLGVSGEWIAEALADHRLFLFLGPDEVKYLPAFYGDLTIDRHTLEEVGAMLGGTWQALRNIISTRGGRRSC